MRDAIVFSTWDWNTFNVPERVALALVHQGFQVLYCEMPISRFRHRDKSLREIHPGIQVFCRNTWARRFKGSQSSATGSGNWSRDKFSAKLIRSA